MERNLAKEKTEKEIEKIEAEIEKLKIEKIKIKKEAQGVIIFKLIASFSSIAGICLAIYGSVSLKKSVQADSETKRYIQERSQTDQAFKIVERPTNNELQYPETIKFHITRLSVRENGDIPIYGKTDAYFRAKVNGVTTEIEGQNKFRLDDDDEISFESCFIKVQDPAQFDQIEIEIELVDQDGGKDQTDSAIGFFKIEIALSMLALSNETETRIFDISQESEPLLVRGTFSPSNATIDIKMEAIK